MIGFINKKLKDQFDDNKLNPKLRVITHAAFNYCYYHYGKNLWITSIYREGDKGVHGYYRGLDCDNDNLTIKQRKEVVDYINSLFVYDPDREAFKVCIFHTVKGRGGNHLHFQVHPNTTMREL